MMKYQDVMMLQSWWMARLRELTKKVNQEEEKRQAVLEAEARNRELDLLVNS